MQNKQEVVFDLDAAAFSSDDFRMYQFKVKRCPRARPHDWTCCPFAHPGEKAKRRCPKRYKYSGTACPEFRRNGCCRRGDACPFAHGVFECWLHPTRYRTQMCTDGTACKRRVCFFAHTDSELRKPEEDPAWLQQELQRGLAEEQQQLQQMQVIKVLSNLLGGGSAGSPGGSGPTGGPSPSQQPPSGSSSSATSPSQQAVNAGAGELLKMLGLQGAAPPAAPAPPQLAPQQLMQVLQALDSQAKAAAAPQATQQQALASIASSLLGLSQGGAADMHAAAHQQQQAAAAAAAAAAGGPADQLQKLAAQLLGGAGMGMGAQDPLHARLAQLQRLNVADHPGAAAGKPGAPGAGSGAPLDLLGMLAAAGAEQAARGAGPAAPAPGAQQLAAALQQLGQLPHGLDVQALGLGLGGPETAGPGAGVAPGGDPMALIAAALNNAVGSAGDPAGGAGYGAAPSTAGPGGLDPAVAALLHQSGLVAQPQQPPAAAASIGALQNLMAQLQLAGAGATGMEQAGGDGAGAGGEAAPGSAGSASGAQAGAEGLAAPGSARAGSLQQQQQQQQLMQGEGEQSPGQAEAGTPGAAGAGPEGQGQAGPGAAEGAAGADQGLGAQRALLALMAGSGAAGAQSEVLRRALLESLLQGEGAAGGAGGLAGALLAGFAGAGADAHGAHDDALARSASFDKILSQLPHGLSDSLSGMVGAPSSN